MEKDYIDSSQKDREKQDLKAGKSLVIVESPTKARTIAKFLGSKFSIKPTMGHIIDLPERQLGVSIKKGFQPYYIVMPNKKKIIQEIEKQAKSAGSIYVATDPDREGEAIGWLIKEYLKNKGISDANFYRVEFHEITPKAIREAFSHPRDFNENLVEAQKARRILDRIVGYYISPILWRKVAKGLSAGRVQSVALRLVVEREREIRNFVPKEYWQVEADFELDNKVKLGGFYLSKLNSKKPEISDESTAKAVKEKILSKSNYFIALVEKKKKKKNPPAPFITSTLQQAAFNRLRFSATKTMQIAQQLYEGIDLGQEARIGLITYMRTDSVNVSEDAISEVRDFIEKKLGIDYLPVSPNRYKSKKGAQEAHEAIRPTSVFRTPESLKEHLSKDQYLLYKLIWERFVASQMKPAIYEQELVIIADNEGEFEFRKTYSKKVFPGFAVIYQEVQQEDSKNKEMEEDNNQDSVLPDLQQGVAVTVLNVRASQHFTKPPARYNDASLVKELEERGIGRPSTYAPTIQTLLTRGYVKKMRGYLVPTELGEKIADLLIKFFPEIMDYDFTAKMEEDLDKIEDAKADRLDILNKFYPDFVERVSFASKNMKKEVEQTDQVCEKCGSPMVIRWTVGGKFLSCSNFPNCRNAKPLPTGVKCPNCGGDLVLRIAGSKKKSGRRRFYGCSNYPKCNFTVSDLSKLKAGESKEQKSNVVANKGQDSSGR